MITRPITRPLASSITRPLTGGNITLPEEPSVPTHTMLPVLGTAAVKKVWFDNDEEDDTYTTESIIAAHLNGKIQLVGFSSTAATSTVGDNPTLPDAYFNQDMTDRTNLITEMGQSGWNTALLPALKSTFKGRMGTLNTNRALTPAAGHPHALALVNAANAHVTPGQRLIVVCGGQLTILGDAWLLDPDLPNKVVVMFVAGDQSLPAGQGFYNEWADPSAAVIVHEKFTMVNFPAAWPNVSQPVVTKADILARLPQSPLRVHMNAKTRTGNSLPGDMDGDGNPVVCLLNPTLVRTVTRQTATGLQLRNNGSDRSVSALVNDSTGKIHYCDVRQTATGCTTTNGSANITISDSGGGLFVGQSVQGSTIPAGAKITSTDGSTTATISIAATGGGSGQTLMLNSKAGTDTWWHNMTRPALWTRGLNYNLNLLASDNFAGTEGSALTGGWAQIGSIARNQIVSNTAGKTTTGYAFDIRTDSHPNGDQYAQMKFTSAPVASYFPAVAVRAAFHSGSDVNGYYLFPNATTDARLQRSQSAVNTVILSGMPAITAGTYWRVTAYGNLIGVWRSGTGESGVIVAGWKLLGIIQDTGLTTGKPALLNSRSAGPTSFADDYQSGTLTV
ncbi:MAG: hypothetical protein EOP88_19550 [Verrucomicrobiaceae bacterium]|nr:MAG: hypothetical protein EOP88_19550 [Verrucomicrobiaceae bacterium]